MTTAAKERRKLSEAQAWREIARRYADRYWTTPLFFVDLSVLRQSDSIDDDVLGRAKDRVKPHTRDLKAYRKMDEGDAILAALWLALEAESEAELRAASPTGCNEGVFR
jgi:hypothetical protein